MTAASRPEGRRGRAREEMTSQERVRTAISRKQPDRVPVMDGPWGATVRRWEDEGLPRGADPADYFGYEIVRIGADCSPRFPVRTIEENEEYIVQTTSTGAVRRNHRDFSTTPEIVDCPIKRSEDWPAIRERLTPDIKRMDWASSWRAYQSARERGLYVVYSAVSGYDLLQGYMRSEHLLAAMATEPGLVKEMMDVTSDLALECARMMWDEGFRFDGAWFFNDMGYRNSSLFSPAMYGSLIAPADRKRNDWFHEHGMQTILHSCGRVRDLIPALVDAGFDCLQPLEVKAGMDLRELKPLYGDRIAFFGGIDTMLMEDPDERRIEEEIRTKLAAAMPGGGYLYHSDHSIPKDVSFQRYMFVMDCVRKYGRYSS
jgi:uroporphyrinogen decarboxylase